MTVPHKITTYVELIFDNIELMIGGRYAALPHYVLQSVCLCCTQFELVNGDVIHRMLVCPARLFLGHSVQVTMTGKAHIQNDLQLENRIVVCNKFSCM